MINNPLSAQSEVVDARRRWNQDWFRWLHDLIVSLQEISAELAAVGGSINYGMFQVDRNGIDQSPGPGNTKIQFTNKNVDKNTLFDTTTNFHYKPDKAGWYNIVLQVFVDDGEAILYKNGNPFAFGTDFGGAVASGANISSVQALVFMNGTTDFIEGWATILSPGVNIYGDPTTTFMLGWRVSA